MPMTMTDPYRCAAAAAERAVATERPAPAELDRWIRVERSHRPGGYRIWIRAARVRQWTKNVLVFAAPAAAGATGSRPALAPVVITCFAFCLVATGCYLGNDVRDADEDRRHPLKRHRPIAAGALAPERALAAATITIGLGLVLAMAANLEVFASAAAYVSLNAAYTLRLRGIVFVEMVAISGAFVLRVIAGAAAGGVPPSRALIAAVAFGALFAAAGKRYADFIDPSARRSRAVLGGYSRASLRLVMALACAAALATYCAWALTPNAGDLSLARELTIIPLTCALLRYAIVASRGEAGTPENVLFADRRLQLFGLTWVLLFAAGA
jgi:decaprenyl-phosphate phosphoribosyltransferase